MITDYMRKNILTYKDAIEYLTDVYRMAHPRNNLRNVFTPALKDVYELLLEHEAIQDARVARRKKVRGAVNA
jgi:hypothetical protein